MYLSISQMLRQSYSNSKQRWKVWVKYLLYLIRETGTGHLYLRSIVGIAMTSSHDKPVPIRPGCRPGKPQGKEAAVKGKPHRIERRCRVERTIEGKEGVGVKDIVRERST